MSSVLLLDGDQRSSLAVVRSLGGKGIKVCVGDVNCSSLAARSRYCSAAFRYPSPELHPDLFLTHILDMAAKNRGAILLPMTDITMGEILSQKQRLSEFVHIPFAGHDAYMELSDKEHLFRMAEKLGIAVPATFYSSDLRLSTAWDGTDFITGKDLSYPVVVKPAASRIRTEHGWMSTTVGYAHNPSQLHAMLTSEASNHRRHLIQEKIDGPGIGIFLLVAEGHTLARFAHQRVREKPPSGGVSVVCRSIDPPADALRAGEALLHAAGWSGVAMVEFKRDRRDNQCKLMEVNARFWGSLQLAISAGVDFPYLLYRLAAKTLPIDAAPPYRTGLFSRWELGDLDHLLIRLKGSRSELNLSSQAPSKSETITRFLVDFVRPEIRTEVFRRDDCRPFFNELKHYINNLVRKLN